MYPVTMSNEGTTTAAVYVRISSDPAGERAGVERQRLECEQLADRHGLQVVATFEDNDVSAYSGKPRPEFERLLSAAAAGDFGHVIVWATDRLYRRMADLVRITSDLAPYVRIHVVTGGEVDLSTAEGILRAQVMGSVAEFESRRKGERIKARAAQRAQNGTMTASIRPRGWRWADPCPGDDTCRHKTRCEPGQRARIGSRSGLLLDPTEAPVIAECYRMVRDGRSLQAAVRHAVGNGVAMTGGASTMRSVLLNARNAGLVAHRGQIVAQAADGLALIDRDTYEAVVSILTDPTRRTSGSKVAPPLGGGLAVCPKCGGNLAAGRKQDGHGRSTGTATYVCSKNMHFTRRRHLLDAPVLDLVGQVLTTAAGSGLLSLADGDDEDVRQLRDDILVMESKLDTLAGLLAAGDLDPADYALASKKLRQALADLTARLSRRTARPAVAQLAADAEGVGAAYARLREADDTDGLRALLADVLVTVIPNPDGSTTLVWQQWVGPAPSIIPAPGPTRPDQATRREQVAAMHADGATITAICEATGANRSTIRNDLRALGLRDQRRAAA